MPASYPPNPLPDEAFRVALEDWDFLFEAVLARLRDAVARDDLGRPMGPMVLECVDTLARLRQTHPCYVR